MTKNEVVGRYFAALNQIDRQAYLDCFTTEATVLDPYGGRPLQGQAGLHKFMDGLERTWATFQMVPGREFAAGDRIAVSWEATATSHAAKTATFAGINVFTLSDTGQISQLEGYWDFKAMLAQIK